MVHSTQATLLNAFGALRVSTREQFLCACYRGCLRWQINRSSARSHALASDHEPPRS